MRVSLAPSFSPIKAPGTASVGLPLLDEAGAQIILGWTPSDLAGADRSVAIDAVWSARRLSAP